MRREDWKEAGKFAAACILGFIAVGGLLLAGGAVGCAIAWMLG